MRGPLLLFVAAGVGCSFEVGATGVDSGRLVGTDTETAEGSTTVASTSASTPATSSGSMGSVGTTATTDSELTTGGADDPKAFVQELLVTNPGDYDFSEVPLLVTLSSDNTQWNAIEPDLSNLRFIGRAGGDDIELAFEVAGVGDAWAQLWVLLPEVSSESDRFRVEYGMGVSPDARPPQAIWGAYEAVWHLGEDPADPEPQYRDSSGNGRHITNREKDMIPSKDMVPGIVGRAPRFTEDRELQISSSDWPESNIGERFTVEAWVQYEVPPPNAFRTIVRKLGAYELVG